LIRSEKKLTSSFELFGLQKKTRSARYWREKSSNSIYISWIKRKKI